MFPQRISEKYATLCVLMFLYINDQTSSFACYMRHHSGPFLSFLACNMGVPSDQFLHLLWRPPYVFFSYGPSWRPLGFTTSGMSCGIARAPKSLSSLNINANSATLLGPLRSVSSHTICEISFIVYYMGPPSDQFFACYRGGATTDFSFFTKYMGAPSDQFLRLPALRLVSLLTIWGPLRSVSEHTFWGPLSDHFFLLLYMGPPQISFFAYYMGVPEISFFVPPQISFSAYYMGAPLDHFFCIFFLHI